MSTMIRYEIEITFPEVQDDEDRAKLIGALRDAIAFHPDAGFKPDDDPSTWAGGVTFSGEESDWSRDHEERHKAVVTAVEKALPNARVQTRWLNLEYLDWDASFNTQDEDEEEEDADAATQG